MANIYILDDDETFGKLMSKYVEEIGNPIVFKDAISAISKIDEDKPELIFLDILLDGPDGFTFLNELMSYPETSEIPIVIVSSLGLNIDKLENYGIKYIFNKETMTPEDVKFIARKLLEQGQNEGKQR